MLRYLPFVLVLGAAFIASCLPPPDGCTPASTRCAKGAAEICTAIEEQITTRAAVADFGGEAKPLPLA